MMKVKTNQQLDINAQKNIFNFVHENYSNDNLFVNNGPGRKFYSTKIPTNFSKFLKEQRQFYFSKLNLNKFEEEPMFETFVGVNIENGSVHLHKDDTKNGFVHFRLNFLISKPYQGGNPVIENQEIEVQELESWINLASEWMHKSTPVVGEKPRIVLSCGALITKKQAEMVVEQCNIY